MKKLTILSAFVMLAATMLSCSKESATTQRTSVSFTQTPTSGGEIKFASPWFLPLFKIVSDRSSTFLLARQDHGSSLNYDQAIHVALAYVKLGYNHIQITKRLPIILSALNLIPNEFIEINFSADITGCDVTLKNADRQISNVITDNPFPDIQVRYIIITRNRFESLNIDWDDYSAVANALGI